MDAQRRTALILVTRGVGCAPCTGDWGITLRQGWGQIHLIKCKYDVVELFKYKYVYKYEALENIKYKYSFSNTVFQIQIQIQFLLKCLV